MSDSIELYKLAKLYDSSEDRNKHVEQVLSYFLGMGREDQLLAVDHYFLEVRHSEQLKGIYKELFDEPTIMKRHDQEIKLWLFKTLIVFGLFVIFFFLLAMQSLEKITGSASSLEAIFKFLRMLINV